MARRCREWPCIRETALNSCQVLFVVTFESSLALPHPLEGKEGQKMIEDIAPETNKLQSFEARVSECFDAIDSRFDRMERRLEVIDQRLENLDAGEVEMHQRWQRVLKIIADTRILIGANSVRAGKH